MSPDGNVRGGEFRQRTCARFATGMAAPCRDHAGLDHRRRGNEVGRGGAARRAGGIRRAAGASLIAVHDGDAGICLWRRGHGPASRRHRNFGSARRRRAGALPRLSRRCRRRQPCRVRAGACRHRVRHLGDVRSADGGHFILVCPPPRRRGDAVLGRQLYCRHGVAAGGAACHRALWLARNSCRHRIVLRRGDAFDRVGRLAPEGSGGARGCQRRDTHRDAGKSRTFARGAANLAGAGFGLLLRGDLGYGVARGADMLALMMAFGIVGRIGSGFIADRVGGLLTLMLGSALQGVALLLYLLYDGLVSLYVISAVFGLFQGGIVPSYATIVREYFPAKEAGARIGIILMTSLFGMALGGWMSGYVFDLTGSYRAAFFNGLGWNAVNGTIVLWLLFRRQGRVAYA